jgi:hypothetical protein
MGWPDQLENGKLLEITGQSGFDVMVTSDQNIRYQQNLTGRKLALVVLGSNIWPVVRKHGAAITAGAGKLCVYRNAASAETAKKGRALNGTSRTSAGARCLAGLPHT